MALFRSLALAATPTLAAPIARAQDPSLVCRPVAVLEHTTDVAVQNGWRVEKFSGPDVQKFLVVFNTTEPATAVEADTVYLFTRSDLGAFGIILFVTSDQVCTTHTPVPARVIPELEKLLHGGDPA